jgi:hypothetical protein
MENAMPLITPELCHAARALVKADLPLLSETSGVAVDVIRDYENNLQMPSEQVVKRLQQALEELGAIFLPEEQDGAGVRLKFDRQERKGLSTWEGEGGLSADDVVP